MSGDLPTRTVVVHCPHWPVVAAARGSDGGKTPGNGAEASEPEAMVVVRANRVVAASPEARRVGVEVGMRRREAQRRCPHADVVGHDPDRDARCFEPVAAAFDVLTPGVEVSVPGTLAFATRGPSRYTGGDESLAERTGWIATGATGGAEVGVGVADGSFAALLAARQSIRQGQPVVVAPGESPGYLASLPVAALTRAALDLAVPVELTELLARLGLKTIGQVAQLDGADLLGRFGEMGVVVHRLARGLDARPLAARRPAPELKVSREVDPPADQVDRAAFVARVLAGELHESLEGRGLACTRVLVEAETDHGETLARHWRHEGALTPAALTDRVRWQLDGWLSGGAAVRPTAGIVRITLVPVEVVAARGRQLGFWGGETLVDERILRAVARLQGTLGAGSVRVAEMRGGRGPADRVVQVPVETVDLTTHRPAARLVEVDGPWPGRVPDPAPASVLEPPEPVQVLDVHGHPVVVTGRAEVSSPPVRFSRRGQPARKVVGWCGPWPVEERWWDPTRHRRRARFQLVDDTGDAHLLAVESGQWWLEAIYD
ncbi:MAG: DNA polymerase Y family protein [Microthrixaceae bacterium]|nr:DNA polymerase Y family protein [Microthrixaceae bacterium]